MDICWINEEQTIHGQDICLGKLWGSEAVACSLEWPQSCQLPFKDAISEF